MSGSTERADVQTALAAGECALCGSQCGQDRAEAAARTLDSLATALRAAKALEPWRFYAHKKDCASGRLLATPDSVGCDCGLDAALAAASTEGADEYCDCELKDKRDDGLCGFCLREVATEGADGE